MRRFLLGLLALLLVPLSAQAADNYTATQGAGTTFRAKDVGAGLLLPMFGIQDAAGAIAAVKAASTAAATTDPAIVVQNAYEHTDLVQLHTDMTAAIPDCGVTPCANRIGIVNQGQSVPVVATLQSAAVANANGTNLNTAGMASAVLTVNCATCSGGTLINFEGSEDGTNFAALTAVQLGTNTLATTTTTSGVTIWELPVAGLQAVRARISAYSAGTVTVTGHTVPVSYDPKVVNANIVTGGSTPYTPFVPAASDNHQTIKNGAGTVFHVAVTNNSATKNYLRLYDAGTGFNACNSATGVIFAMEIPPTDSGFSVQTGGINGLSFSTGLSLCVTSGFGLTDTTNATATAMYVNVAYK